MVFSSFFILIMVFVVGILCHRIMVCCLFSIYVWVWSWLVLKPVSWFLVIIILLIWVSCVVVVYNLFVLSSEIQVLHNSFGNLWGNSQIPYLLLIITLRFTCREKKICSSIKMSQNIMSMIAVLVYLPNVDRPGQGEGAPKNFDICAYILYGWPLWY